MIKNVIFDFGQVMVRFDPEYMVGKYVSAPEDRRLLEEVVFDRLYWDRLDAGTIEDEEVTAACRERVPERLHGKIDEIYYNWIYNLPPIDGMTELVRELKEEYGIRVYLLSNISHYFAEHERELSALDGFDGKVFSAEIGMTKPSREIFEYITSRYRLDPEKTIFVDDNEKNIEGARAFGIGGYLFDGDSKRLKDYLIKEITK